MNIPIPIHIHINIHDIPADKRLNEGLLCPNIIIWKKRKNIYCWNNGQIDKIILQKK